MAHAIDATSPRAWRADRYDSRNYDGSTREGYVIHDGADVVASMIRSANNARLMAAAPRLYAALKQIMDRKVGDDLDAYWWQDALAALAQADGRQS